MQNARPHGLKKKNASNGSALKEKQYHWSEVFLKTKKTNLYTFIRSKFYVQILLRRFCWLFVVTDVTDGAVFYYRRSFSQQSRTVCGLAPKPVFFTSFMVWPIKNWRVLSLPVR